MSKKIGLGRGLKSLLSDTPSTKNLTEVRPVAQSQTSGMSEILLSEIETNPFQPRKHFDQEALKELADSIKIHGIIQPLTVRKLANNRFQLIAGERRFQASKIAGLKAIPAFVRSANDQQMLEMGLIENIQRENLNPIEISLSYQRLISECNLKQDELAGRVGKNRSTVTNYLRLLKLPPDIQIALRDNKLSMGHARAIINIENADAQLYVFKKILEEELSVRKVEELVRDISATSKKSITPAKAQKSNPARDINKLQSKLSSHFGTKVSIKSDGKKGELKIPFLSIEDLNRILGILRV